MITPPLPNLVVAGSFRHWSVFTSDLVLDVIQFTVLSVSGTNNGTKINLTCKVHVHVTCFNARVHIAYKK